MESDQFVLPIIEHVRLSLNKLVAKGFLRDIWEIIKDFENYKIYFNIEEKYLYNNEGNDDKISDKIHLIGHLSRKGYECHSKGIIKWEPTKNITEINEFKKDYEKRLKSWEKNEEERFFHPTTGRIIKTPRPYSLLPKNLYTIINKYDKFSFQRHIGLMDFDPTTIDADDIEFADLSLSMYLKLNSIIFEMLRKQLEFSLKDDKDLNNIQYKMDSVYNDNKELFRDPSFDDYYHPTLYFQIYASFNENYEDKDYLIGCDCDEWDLLLEDRMVKNGDILVKGTESFELSKKEQAERRRKYKSLPEIDFKEEKDLIKQSIMKDYGDFNWYKRLCDDAKSKFIEAEFVSRRPQYLEYASDYIIDNLIDAVKKQSFHLLTIKISEIFSIIDSGKYEFSYLHNKIKEGLKIINNSGHSDFPFWQIGKIIYHLFWGFNNKKEIELDRAFVDLNGIEWENYILEFDKERKHYGINLKPFQELNDLRNYCEHSKSEISRINPEYVRGRVIECFEILSYSL